MSSLAAALALALLAAGVALSIRRARRPRLVLDSGTARAAWLAEDPEAEVARVVLADDGHSALLKLLDGRRAVVWTEGARIATRELDPEGARISATDGRLVIRFPGWMGQRLSVPFADPRGRDDWISGAPTGAA